MPKPQLDSPSWAGFNLAMLVSVLICTHNPRREYLSRVLDALRNQTLPFDQWELLLIDNASTQTLSEVWDLSWHPHARHIREDELGVMHARQRAMREFRGELFVFVDDDNVLDKNYLEEAWALAAKYQIIGCFGGSSIPEFETEPPAWSTPYLSFALALYTVSRDCWGNIGDIRLTPFGAGMVVRRSVAEFYLKSVEKQAKKVKLGRSGKELYSYEDSEIAESAPKSGAGYGRFLALRLTHLIPSRRLTLDYFLRHAEDDAFSYVFYRRQNGLHLEYVPPRGLRKLLWFVKSVLRGDPFECRKIQMARWRGHERAEKVLAGQEAL